ncbi:MAG: hypothetical protein ABIH11_05430 [Candidatus Altiarchaeota archaeon]
MSGSRGKLLELVLRLTPKPWQMYASFGIIILAWIAFSTGSCTPPDALSYVLMFVCFILAFAGRMGVLDKMDLRASTRVWLVELIIGLSWSILLMGNEYMVLMHTSGIPYVGIASSSLILLPSHMASTALLILANQGFYLPYTTLPVLTALNAVIVSVFAGHLITAYRKV